MTFSFDVVSLIPDSPLSAVTVAVMSVLPIEPPLRPTVAFSAIAKQAACADATSSSGLVCPAGSPMRAGNVTGSANAPLPALTCPLPSMIEPVHSTSACRENVAIPELQSEQTVIVLLASFGRDAELNERADQPHHQPDDKHPALPGCRIQGIRQPDVVFRRRLIC